MIAQAFGFPTVQIKWLSSSRETRPKVGGFVKEFERTSVRVRTDVACPYCFAPLDRTDVGDGECARIVGLLVDRDGAQPVVAQPVPDGVDLLVCAPCRQIFTVPTEQYR